MSTAKYPKLIEFGPKMWKLQINFDIAYMHAGVAAILNEIAVLTIIKKFSSMKCAD